MAIAYSLSLCKAALHALITEREREREREGGGEGRDRGQHRKGKERKKFKTRHFEDEYTLTFGD